jgi:hypothetical protein
LWLRFGYRVTWNQIPPAWNSTQEEGFSISSPNMNNNAAIIRGVLDEPMLF